MVTDVDNDRLGSKVKGISVMLPAYNEAEVIEDTINKILLYLRHSSLEGEIIVVDDGSEDETGAKARQLADRDGRVRVISHDQNKGYGEALRSGFNAAQKEWIFLMDADGQFDIRELNSFLPWTGDFDMIAGYRANRADPLVRAIFTWGYNVLLKILFTLPVRDIGCAFKLFKRSLWIEVQPIESEDHKIFSVEFIWKAKKLGARIKELPVRHFVRQGGKATGSRGDVVWAMIRAMVQLRIKG